MRSAGGRGMQEREGPFNPRLGRCQQIAALPPDVPFDFAHGLSLWKGGMARPFRPPGTTLKHLGWAVCRKATGFPPFDGLWAVSEVERRHQAAQPQHPAAAIFSRHLAPWAKFFAPSELNSSTNLCVGTLAVS